MNRSSIPLGVTVVAGTLLSTLLILAFSSSISTTDAFVPASGSRLNNNGFRADSFTTTTALFVASEEISAREALERTRKQLEEMQKQQQQQQRKGLSVGSSNGSLDPRIEKQTREYLSFPANALKKELKSNGLPTKGRKPDLAKRLAEFEYLQENPDDVLDNNDDGVLEDGDSGSSQRPTKYLDPKTRPTATKITTTSDDDSAAFVMNSFCGLTLSETAGKALGRARFDTPTPIQRKSLKALYKGHSAVLHAETGSGKTLAYLLPITEAMWRDEQEQSDSQQQQFQADESEDLRYGIILTPTRELAAQVAGVASVLAPPGSVRLVSRPTNLMSEGRYWKERRGDRVDDPEFMSRETQLRGRGSPPRLFVGSAKAIMGSLYGDGKMPASPTRKPAARELLSQTRWVVLDEVDRLLNVKTKRGLSTTQRNQMEKKNNAFQYGEEGARRQKNKSGGSSGPLHEKPAAVLTSAIARRTLGRAQVISASATVGRGLKRELSRVLGLPPREYPRVIRGDQWDSRYTVDEDGYDIDDEFENDREHETVREHKAGQGHVDRAVTVPETVTNYVLPVDASSVGKLLTNAYFAVKNLNQAGKRPQKILVVLTKNCDVTTSNAIGALKHFKCQPEPQSLLDVLQNADGNDQLMDVHRKVSGSDGLGEEASSSYFGDTTTQESSNDDDDGKGYILVTGEDTVRGMHLAGLDTVVVVGRASGPDEYIHIAGRTGRAGKRGKVINVLSEAHSNAMQGWEKMLNVSFRKVSMEDIEGLE
uniref:RNA helicase n=1 Tax=Pseudo-nitzschia australis TaxID=44445 RepID=A0A7S4AT74_9STRA|mmetsp:Transcript_10985/g.23339  ORF Transcript_10985/g.23339 Transcript_10985/m.23339 type:complete len:764 (-) Transcript_10985:1580-3871(-)